ncbi:MAG: DNA repair protein RadA [Bacillota bacterium]|jgi:DNA repair protein RadA/Sms
MKARSKFVCQACGYETPKWLGRCPECGEWGTLQEEAVRLSTSSVPRSKSSPPVRLQDVRSMQLARRSTAIAELDRVLGSGIVSGEVVLVGGDPGIGKSTLLMQLAGNMAAQGVQVLYVSGEESVEQTKLRADRLRVGPGPLFLAAETDAATIMDHLLTVKPEIAIIDSIQTMHDAALSSAPGTVSQVRECASKLIRYAKESGAAVFLVGHVTKEGSIAGPKVLEHMVDAVLHFEGERHQSFRILRAVKNRFGSTNEIGVFQMGELGLREVANPSQLFLGERPVGVAGSVVVAAMEGTRPVLVEVQALLASSSLATPRRMTSGVDGNRVAMILAVLEKRLGMQLQYQDTYVNAVGGVRIPDPAADLGMAIAIASSFRDRPTGPLDLILGEVGLTGEVRAVSRAESRINEAVKLGFRRVILPKANLPSGTKRSDIQLIGISSVADALQRAFD